MRDNDQDPRLKGLSEPRFWDFLYNFTKVWMSRSPERHSIFEVKYLLSNILQRIPVWNISILQWSHRYYYTLNWNQCREIPRLEVDLKTPKDFRDREFWKNKKRGIPVLSGGDPYPDWLWHYRAWIVNSLGKLKHAFTYTASVLMHPTV